KTEVLNEDLARQFIGGQGLGARIVFERQKKGADPLGPESLLGFTTGPLTGTKTPTGRPPQSEGPVAGVSLDVGSLAREYRQAMGWDPQSGIPANSTLENLGLATLVKDHG
ncbi:aldehyde ferredoxin oxidoreductase N-terminal domain-containing protein, partial [Thermodesulfobacteriota bacterium]